MIKIGNTDAYDTLKEHISLIISEKLSVIINKYLIRNESFPEHIQIFFDIEEIYNRINNNRIKSAEIRELINQIRLSRLVELLYRLFPIDYLFKLISIDDIRHLERLHYFN